MGFSRASKDLLMKASNVATKGVLAVGNVGVKAHDKVMTALEKNDSAFKQAEEIMNKKYPSGWSQSETNMLELESTVRKIKNK